MRLFRLPQAACLAVALAVGACQSPVAPSSEASSVAATQYHTEDGGTGSQNTEAAENSEGQGSSD